MGLDTMKLNFGKLFSGRTKEAEPLSSPAAARLTANPLVAASLYVTSTGEDYEEFLKLMKQGKRPYRKPGISVKDEYEIWLGALAKERAATVPSRAQA